MNPNTNSFWKLETEKWGFFQTFDHDKQKKFNNPTEIKIYNQEKKPLVKGSIVFTSEGFGVVQDIESESKDTKFIEEESNANFLVKIKDSVKKFDSFNVFSSINVVLKIIMKNTILQEQIFVPTNGVVEDIMKKINDEKKNIGALTKKTNLSNPVVLYKGKKLTKTENSKKISEFLTKNNEIFVVSFSMLDPITIARYDTSLNCFSDYWEMTPDRKDVLSFQVNKNITLMGVAVFNLSQSHKNNNYNLTNYQKHCKLYLDTNIQNSSNILAEGSVFLSFMDQSHIDNIKEKKLFDKLMFTNPIEIKRDVKYTLVLIVYEKGQVFNLEQGKTPCEGKDGIEFQFFDHSDSDNSTDTRYGQFPQIYYAI